jgi:hypothetical protein
MEKKSNLTCLPMKNACPAAMGNIITQNYLLAEKTMGKLHNRKCQIRY